jgi:hypothetical protein
MDIYKCCNVGTANSLTITFLDVAKFPALNPLPLII